MIVFDEAHALKNSTQQMGGEGDENLANGAGGRDVAELDSKARIVYVSATGATEVANLAYCERLGLWGEGTASQQAAVYQRISDGGLAAMEWLPRHESDGLVYVQIAFIRWCEYDRLTHELTPDQTKIMMNSPTHGRSSCRT